jgi:iron(II)-dependent oxidoreductase
MVNISGSTYTIGRAQADEYHIAQQNISLESFWIDQYQVTNAEYQQFMDQTGAQSPMVFLAEARYPVRGVTWDQANAYCAWKNKRLPDEAEWEVAGRGSGSNPPLYPWGNDANHALQLPEDDTYEVGSIEFNISPFGVHDLVGNVWEWTANPYATIQEGFKILRGGRYGLPQDLAYRLAVTSDNELYVKYAGFRCATDQTQ